MGSQLLVVRSSVRSADSPIRLSLSAPKLCGSFNACLIFLDAPCLCLTGLQRALALSTGLSPRFRPISGPSTLSDYGHEATPARHIFRLDAQWPL